MDNQTLATNKQLETNGNKPQFDYEIKLAPKIIFPPVSGIGKEGVTHPKHKELFDEGRTFSIAGEIKERDPEHIKVLTEKARNAAREISRSAAETQADRELQEKLKEKREDQKLTKDQIKVAEANFLDAREEQAKFPQTTTVRPEEPVLLVLGSTILIAVPLIYTIVELWKSGDPVINFIVAMMISVGIGFATAKILFFVPSTKSSEDKNPSRIAWLAAIGIAAGLGILRIALSSSYEMAVGFSIFEFFLVLVIEIAARRHRNAIQTWDEKNEVQDMAKNLTEIRRNRVEELAARKNNLNKEIEEIRMELNLIEVIINRPQELEDSFASSVEAGYLQGIGEVIAQYTSRIVR